MRSPAQDPTAASVMSANKNEYCECLLGIVGQKATWRTGAQARGLECIHVHLSITHASLSYHLSLATLSW
jgi:hypothetical protein